MGERRLPVRVWDAPTRLFHWAIVVLLCISWLTESRGWMELHFLAGYSVLALLLFRVVWGFVGSDTARFTHFLSSPLAALQHLAQLHRREPDTEIGHNAAGGWMVLLMLVLLAVQVGTGLSPTTTPTPRDRCSTMSARNERLAVAHPRGQFHPDPDRCRRAYAAILAYAREAARPGAADGHRSQAAAGRDAGARDGQPIARAGLLFAIAAGWWG